MSDKPVLTYLRKCNLKFRTFALPLFLILILLLTIILALLSYQKSEAIYLMMSLRSSAPGEATLYYDLGGGFREEDKAVTQIRKDPTALVYTFAIPNRDLFRFRFDPPDAFEGEISIGNIRIVNARGKTLREIDVNRTEAASSDSDISSCRMLRSSLPFRLGRMIPRSASTSIPRSGLHGPS